MKEVSPDIMKNKNYSDLEKVSLNEGMDLFGVADIGKIKDNFLLSQRVLAKLDKAVCIGMRVSDLVLEEIEQAPTKLYFHHYRNVNIFLDQAALKIAVYIQKKGYQALAIPSSQILDWEKQNAHASHKKLGALAGMGWIGRNNLLVNKELGAQFRLVSILTDMPLKLDSPEKENCNSCQLCVKICPAGAIKQSPVEFVHAKCFEKLREFQKHRVVDQYVCGVCVKVCGGKRNEK